MTPTIHVNELEDSVFIEYLKQFLKDAIRRGVPIGGEMPEIIKTVDGTYISDDYQKSFWWAMTELIASDAKIAERDTKITNLHTIITKQAERIKRQAARITELEALYAGTKRSKKAATIKAKYKALKAWVEQTRWRIAL